MFFSTSAFKIFFQGWGKCSLLLRTLSACSFLLSFAQFLEWAGPGFCLERMFTWCPCTPGNLWASLPRYQLRQSLGATLCLNPASGKRAGLEEPSSACLFSPHPLCSSSLLLAQQHCSSPLGRALPEAALPSLSVLSLAVAFTRKTSLICLKQS